jgi:predicted  nucleic acid-binding Zn-ribbon protein
MNTESETPRTDNAFSHDGNWDTKALRMANLARQLERELNDVTTERNNLDASLKAAISSSNARHFESMEHEAKSKQLERELNNAMAALRNLTDEIGKHEGASMMHPRLTRAIAAANRLTNEKK